jgi:uncharacterized protein
MLQILKLISIIYILTNLSVSAQENTTGINIGETISIHSDILNEERKIFVYLPRNHNPKKNYPVIYMMDGESSFHSASGLLQHFIYSEKMPETILISIPNTDRTRDLTPTHTLIGFQGNEQTGLKNSGGGDNFIKFIKTELAPHVEKNYSSSKFRIFIGHSLGGLLVTHAFLENEDFFNSFISIDPSLWWDDKILNKRVIEKLKQETTNKNTFYMSSANNSNAPGNLMLGPQIEFMESLDKWNNKLNYKRDYFDNDTHGSVVLISLYNGLEYIFDNFAVNYDKAVEEPDYLDNHFSTFSKRLGYKFTANEATINRLAYTYLFQKQDKEKALELFIQNTKDHPNSSNSYDSLSDAYNEMDNKEMAIKSLEKAIELDPNAEVSKTKLKGLLESN